MARRRRKKSKTAKRIALACLAIPLAYLAAALVGGLVTVNRDWVEPDDGVTVYLADNGIHADLILPVNEGGLDWETVVPAAAFEEKPGDARWLAFGAGEAEGKFIAIVGARFDRPAQAGNAWEGADVAAAMRLLRTLYEQPWWQQVASLDVSSYLSDQSLTLVTDRGCLITWGRIPGEEMAAEVPCSRKLDYLQHHHSRYGHIDRGFTTLDIRTDTVTTGDVLRR